jgi:hypothetical protein
MACLERKYEDPIFPTHKILGPECSEFPNKVPEKKSIKRNIEEKKKQTKMVGKQVGEIFCVCLGCKKIVTVLSFCFGKEILIFAILS